MPSNDNFNPDWVSAPGETIIDILNEQGLSVAEFSEQMEDSIANAVDLLEGRATITIALARRLSELLGASVEFWMARDFQYRNDVKRIHRNGGEWLRRLPLGDMIKFRWLTPIPRPSEEFAACLRFFDVSSVSEWYDNYRDVHNSAAFRTSSSFDSTPESVISWLRRGQIEAERIQCAPWDPERFHSSLTKLRSLTRQRHPDRFVPELRKACSESGVAVVIVRAPSGCRASGATRFVSQSKAILQFSFRYLTDDHFWFTFFHEAGHLLLHHEAQRFLSGSGLQQRWILEGIEESHEMEKEANLFATHMLIPPNLEPELGALPIKHRDVIRFAMKIGVSPGIVVGQLQHNGRIPYDTLNRLKRRYIWEESRIFTRETV